jgi:hypothetical protein
MISSPGDETAEDDLSAFVNQPRLWRNNGWTARVIKNEDDDGWAVAMIKDGEPEPALVGPWTMGRDKRKAIISPMRIGRAGAQAGLKSERVFREEHDHRRAEQEAAHFIAFLQDDLLVVVAPFTDFADTRWVDVPCQTVAMLPTMVAPTRIRTKGPNPASKTQTTRSLRANRPGTPRAVAGLTENSAPGTWIIRVRRPSTGM